MTTQTITGCLFDNYALKDKIILWIKEKIEMQKDWNMLGHPPFVASYLKSDLKPSIENNQILPLINEYDL
jgi:hypothetical protein